MTVTVTPLASDLVIRLEKETGTGTIARKYQGIKVAASDADVYDVANSLVKLQTGVFSAVERINTIEIKEN